MNHQDSRNRVFPVGLYGTLLVALFGVTFPDLVAPAERLARTVLCLPLRAYSIALHDMEAVAGAGEGWRVDALAGVQARTAVQGALGPEGHRPQVLRVRDRVVGPRGRVDELVLDARSGELADCAPLVTLGPALLGVLDLGADPRARARVRLLPYLPRRDAKDAVPIEGAPPRAVRVPAEVECKDVHVDGLLRFLVEPAREVDRWPLRCTLLDDSYLASRLRRSGAVVTTRRHDELAVPAGLEVGELMIWGYPQFDIPVGLFVEPRVDPRAINVVLAWRRPELLVRSALRPQEVGEELPVRFTRYPAPGPGAARWMVTSSSRVVLPDGAALVDRGRFLGTLRQPWSGQSLVTPFAASARAWALVLLDPGGAVHDLVGRVVGRSAGGRVRIRFERPRTVRAGTLFVGVNGPDCPAGWLLGVSAPDPDDAAVCLVALPDAPVLEPAVFIGGEVERGERPR